MTYHMTEIKWNSIKWFFDRLWEKPDDVPDSGVLLVLKKREMKSLLNKNRTSLLRSMIKSGTFMSLAEIAKQLQWSEESTLQELKALEKLMLLERDEMENWKAREAIILPEIELQIKKLKVVEEAASAM